MSDVKFVIGIKNSEPCPPEFEYYCGPNAPIQTLAACVKMQETVWDIDHDCAEVFRSIEAVAVGLDYLGELFDERLLFVEQRIVSYELLDTEIFAGIIRQNKINNILKMLESDDLEYLQKQGVLDLTTVT